MKIRPARVGDVQAICELIKQFAGRKLMIRRSLGELYEMIRELIVAVDENGRVVGCVGLHVFWSDLAEVKCLAVSEQAQGRGVGRKLVEACAEAARELEIQTLFALTYSPEFFEKCGYSRIEKADLPHKIWNECVRCPLFPNCNEVALTLPIELNTVRERSQVQVQGLDLAESESYDEQDRGSSLRTMTIHAESNGVLAR